MAASAPGVKAVFDRAVEIESATERAAYLAEACADHPDVRQKVEALLRAYADAGSFLEPPVPAALPADATAAFGPPPVDATHTFGAASAEPTSDHLSKDEHAGAVIAGKYTLVEQIGEGGMGSVWRAKQTEPVKRFVAVKLIKAGMDSKQVLARFEAERQALALMDHPNIAKVLDGGLHEQRPYFVMELVKGVPITEYCDACKLTPKERLELFVPVCQAIQHAHQKGIIHRDIKPSNVLIALYDDKPVVKVIDFGVAKATGGALTEKTIDTGFGGVVGTPQYMSPEQATFNNLDIDTRSDVYALGVLLYELLTGSTPFSNAELKKKGLLEILRVVREEEPPRPSTKLSTADALPTLSANRGTEPKKLTGLLRNELDWIVMKALEKDRTRRYETANGFAADVQRYLSGEAVQAHPPSRAYRLRKFVRRNRPQVIAVSLLVLALVAGVIGTTLGLIRAEEQRRIAVANEEKANDAVDAERLATQNAEKRREEAVTERKRADEETAIATAISSFLRDDLLGLANPWSQERKGVPIDPDVKVRTLLDRAALQVEERFRNRPLVEAAVRMVLFETYQGLGLRDESVPHLLRAAALHHAYQPGDVRTFRVSLRAVEQLMYDGTRNEEALRELDRVRVAVAPEEGAVRTDLAIELKVLDLGQYYLAAGRKDDGLRLSERIRDALAASRGTTDPYTLEATLRLAQTYRSAGRPADGFRLLGQVRTALENTPDPKVTAVQQLLREVAFAYFLAGRAADAIPILERLDAQYQGNLADLYSAAGRFDDALRVWERNYDEAVQRHGPLNSIRLNTVATLASAYRRAGRSADAVRLQEQLRDAYLQIEGPDGRDALAAQAGLAADYMATDKTQESLALFESTAPRFRKRFAANAWQLTRFLQAWGEALRQAGQHGRAVDVFREVVEVERKTRPTGDKTIRPAQLSLATALLFADRPVEAEPLLRECLAIWDNQEPDRWTVFNIRSLLGAALLGQKKYADAEPLLLKGYEGMKQREKTIPPAAATRIPEALDRLIELYKVTHKPDEAKKWRAERAKYPMPKEVAPPPREKK